MARVLDNRPLFLGYPDPAVGFGALGGLDPGGGEGGGVVGV
jgi:hypothetical protein